MTRRRHLPAALALAAAVWCSAPGRAADEDLIAFPRDDSFLPRSWVADPIRAEIDPLDPALRETASALIRRALDKYPRSLLNRYLGGVSLVGSLRFYDVAYGGTYQANDRRVILVYRDTFDETGFEQRFHHEFSSILLKHNKKLFDAKRWTAANPPEFSYRAGGIIEHQDGESSAATQVLAEEQRRTGGSGSTLLHLEPDLMSDGFLTRYNQVSIEQDFNETAAHLFTNPDIWEYCRRHPRLDQKVAVLIDFYRRLDPAMDRLHFRKLTPPPDSGDGAPPP